VSYPAPVDGSLDSDWLDELYGWLRIPSVSADAAHAHDVRAAGEWVCDYVRAAGGTCELVETQTHPLAIGVMPASQTPHRAPTVLLYGHFDVQPPGPRELWTSDPFEPELREGWIYGRGAVDDKGNAFLLLKATRLLIEQGALPVNIRVVFDGEEEIGGSSVCEFIERDTVATHACVSFDSSFPELDVPAFELATRGLAYFRLSVRTGKTDLHSGVFGGAAQNAIHALMQILVRALERGDVLGIGLEPADDIERENWLSLRPGAEVLAEEGAQPIDASAARDFYERTFAAPALDVNGISGGEPFLQKGVLPAHAIANASIRVAPGQDVEEVASAFEHLVRDVAPNGAEVKVDRLAMTPAGMLPWPTRAVELAQKAFERVLGRRPLLIRTGGTMPIVPALAQRGIPTVLTGFGVPGSNVHSPNERLLARYIPLGVAAARETLLAFGDLDLGRPH
jgi:acetylornithine deacetylase/succinyl-diaminopimelate desuccinylase-like protein